TFLVRSGILTSVHAFAVDPLRGAFILALLAFYIGGALVLFGLRVRYVKEGSTFEIVSREASLVINNLLLSVILGLVFIGTLYPLVTQALGREISVGPPYFNSAIGPIALALAAGMASDSAFTQETLIAARPGQTIQAGPFNIRFLSAEPVPGPNWTAIEARLEARRGDGEPFLLTPQSRLFDSPPTPTSETSIRT